MNQFVLCNDQSAEKLMNGSLNIQIVPVMQCERVIKGDGFEYITVNATNKNDLCEYLVLATRKTKKYAYYHGKYWKVLNQKSGKFLTSFARILSGR